MGEHAEFARRIELALARVLPRRTKTYSIQEKADALGFSKSFMADLLAGRKMPSAANIMDIAIRTGVKVEWLWTARGPMIEKLAEGQYVFVGDLEPAQQDAVRAIVRSYAKD